MIESTSSNVLDTTGTTTAMSIEVNASMFQLLSRKVYNDPIAAVIREWSTNAIDICVANNLLVQFDVHLPDAADSTFSVRDYGTGLSEDQITGLFSTLGSSTKRSDNRQNGTFGIGRMSGLAYAQAFNVDSFYNGTHSIYTISIIDGIPNTIKMYSGPTDEPNGLKLSVAIEPNDRQQFIDTATNIYRYFDIKPTLNYDLPIVRDDTDDLSDDWFIDSSLKSNANYVLMANVLYEIPYNHSISNKDLSSIVIKLPNGAISFNPGREFINLDSNSIALLNAKFKDILNELNQKLTTTITTKSTDIEKISYYSSIESSLPYAIKSSFNLSNHLTSSLTTLIGNFQYNTNRLGTSSNFYSLYNNKLDIKIKDRGYKNSQKLGNSYTSYENLHLYDFLIIDQKTNFSEIIKQQSKNTIILLRKDSKVSIEDLLVEAKRFLSDIGVTSYKLASTFAVDTVSRAQNKQGIHVCNINSRGVVSQSTKFKSDAKYWYIPVKMTTPDLPESKHTYEDYINLYNLYKKLNPDAPILVGVQQKYMEEVKENPNFSPLIDNIVSSVSSHSITLLDDEIKRFPSHIFEQVPITLPTHIQSCHAVSCKYKDFKEYIDYSYKTVLDDFNIPYTGIKLPKSINELREVYPLLWDYARSHTIEQLTHYLKLENTYASVHQTG